MFIETFIDEETENIENFSFFVEDQEIKKLKSELETQKQKIDELMESIYE